jgi:hypothetical protein
LTAKRARVFPQSLAHRIPESPGIGLVLKADDDVVGVAHNDQIDGE